MAPEAGKASSPAAALSSAVLAVLQGRAENSVQAMGCVFCKALQGSSAHWADLEHHTVKTSAQCHEHRAQPLKPKRLVFSI